MGGIRGFTSSRRDAPMQYPIFLNISLIQKIILEFENLSSTSQFASAQAKIFGDMDWVDS